MENIIVKKISEIAKWHSNYEGNIKEIGTKTCNKTKYTSNAGIYGIAIKITDKYEKNKLFEQIKKLENYRCETKYENGKSIGENWYPLYWGKAKCLGSRLGQHLRKDKKNHSLHLCDKRYDFLCGFEISYGAILCESNKEIERNLKAKYPDVLKTF